MKRLNVALRSAAVGAVPVLTLSLFIALTLYAGNRAEFSASFLDILRMFLPYAVGSIAVIGLLGMFMTPGGVSRYQSMLAALGILTWLQGALLVWDYGVLDGRDIDWLEGAVRWTWFSGFPCWGSRSSRTKGSARYWSMPRSRYWPFRP